jgi:hypothetical protein
LPSERWYTLTHPRTQAKVLALFIEGPTETGGGIEGSKAVHEVIALFDPLKRVEGELSETTPGAPSATARAS